MVALRKVQAEEPFELTDCPDPTCYICNMHKGGYPSRKDVDENGRIKLNPYHQKKLADSMVTLLNWIGSADVNR